MLTIQQLAADKRLRAWETRDARPPERYVYYTARWKSEFNGLSLAAAKLGLAPEPNRKHWLAGFLDLFVAGESLPQLIRPRGYAMGTPFSRIRPDSRGVVELRTQHTRTFGAFGHKNVFVAHHVVPTEHLKSGGKAVPARYALCAAVLCDELLCRLLPSEIDGTSDVSTLF